MSSTFFQNRSWFGESSTHDGESCTAPDDMIRHLEHQVMKLREESSHWVSRMPRLHSTQFMLHRLRSACSRCAGINTGAHRWYVYAHVRSDRLTPSA